MQNEELKPEMKVLVERNGSLIPAKVIGPTTLTVGSRTEITGWVVALERDNLHLTVTADKIHPRG